LFTGIYAILNFYVVYIFIYGQNPIAAGKNLYHYTFQTTWLLNYVESRLLLYIITLLILEINEKYSPGVFTDIFIGKYLKPREEKRIILFIDLKDSTPTAEKLGHKKYFFYIRDFIHHISLALLEYDGLIYQYVGDEVVLTWEVKHGLENSNCLKIFFMFRESLLRNSENYFKNFGVKPEFKAGLHFGKVISAQIGDIKREIVYNGDVLNTTARIQSECNKYQRDCLVSGILMNRLKQMDGFKWERIDAVKLRGKETQVELFSVINEPSLRSQ